METGTRKSLSGSSDKLPRSVVIAGAIMFVIIAIFIGGPKASLLALALLSGLATYRLFELGQLRPVFTLTPLLAALGLFGCYLLINASWSQSPLLAYEKVAIYFLIIAAVTLGSEALKSSDNLFIERLSFNLMLAALVLVVYLSIETIFQSPLRRAFATIFPVFMPPIKHALVVDGVVVTIGQHRLNRSVATACLTLWPALLAIIALYAPPRSWLIAVAVVGVTTLAIFTSINETSKLALIFSALIFVIAVYLPKSAIWMVCAGWSIAAMAVVPIAFTAYSQKLHLSSVLPVTGRARIILWQYTAEKTMKQPLLGIGVLSTRTLEDARKVPLRKPKGFIYPRTTNRHAHNVYLQTWYELGAVGAVLLWLSGLAILWAINKVHARARPFILASFVSAAVTGAFSWGMWQPWFMGAFGMTALLAVMSSEVSRRRTVAAD